MVDRLAHCSPIGLYPITGLWSQGMWPQGRKALDKTTNYWRKSQPERERERVVPPHLINNLCQNTKLPSLTGGDNIVFDDYYHRKSKLSIKSQQTDAGLVKIYYDTTPARTLLRRQTSNIAFCPSPFIPLKKKENKSTVLARHYPHRAPASRKNEPHPRPTKPVHTAHTNS